MKKLILLILIIIASNLIATEVTFAQTITENLKVLLITDDNYGSSFVYGDEKTKSIKQQFEDFGWNITIAADIIRGKNVIGHFDYFEDYKPAGANYIEYSFKLEDEKKIFNNVTPPIKDGNIITTVRSLYYRNEMCQLINKAIEEKSTQKIVE